MRSIAWDRECSGFQSQILICDLALRGSPGFGAGYGDSADFVGILAADGAVEVVEDSIVSDHGGFMGEGFVDGAGCAGVDEYLGDFDEGVGIDAEGEQLTGTAGRW